MMAPAHLTIRLQNRPATVLAYAALWAPIIPRNPNRTDRRDDCTADKNVPTESLLGRISPFGSAVGLLDPIRSTRSAAEGFLPERSSGLRTPREVNDDAADALLTPHHSRYSQELPRPRSDLYPTVIHTDEFTLHPSARPARMGPSWMRT